MSGLTDFQRDVARTFFSLDVARDFVLAGGAALLAHDLIDRVTGDLDLFGSTTRQLDDVVTAFAEAARAHGWHATVIRQSATFARIEIGGPGTEVLVIDLGVDSAPILDTVVSAVGPTYQPEELAARKLVALFGRAEARDIYDVYELAKLFDLDELCDLAVRIDPGFSRAGLIDALGAVGRFDDEDFPLAGATPAQLREFTDEWRHRLLAEE